ncbi:MmyB family transcriptional regulator [Streptomyces pseudogriseolus]|uniref:MmyB family transcriptional regulator n=1 Tax=Streptomyces pseudogriseolus TaxID=36817 RepID=UPI003FA2FF7C
MFRSPSSPVRRPAPRTPVGSSCRSTSPRCSSHGDRSPASRKCATRPAHGLHLRPVSSAAGQDAFDTAIVADLCEAVARYPADPELAALVDELRTASPFFGGQWAVTGMEQLAGDLKTISHPELGDVTLDCDVLTVPGADLRVVTCTAAPGTRDAGQLDLLRASRLGEAR